MSSRDPFDADWRDDVEKFKRLRRRDKQGWSLGSVVELIFASLAGLSALAWFIAMWFVPDPVPGDLWLGLGGLAVAVFAGPAFAIYQLRRGGLGRLRQLIRGVRLP